MTRLKVRNGLAAASWYSGGQQQQEQQQQQKNDNDTDNSNDIEEDVAARTGSRDQRPPVESQ